MNTDKKKKTIPVVSAADKKQKWFILSGVLVIVFVCFHSVLSNTFTNWDDGFYVVNNQYIKSFSEENLKMLMFHNIINNYYHPLTMLSLALNYHFAGLNPEFYYFTNIFIHLLNTCLVFWLTTLLLNAMMKKGYFSIQQRTPNSLALIFNIQHSTFLWAGLCALWFGIHPMHVESVAWISERKDVLYSFFYFAGLICYIYYLKERKIKYYALMLLLFCLSLLSKPMAISFPLSLFSIDLLLKRKNFKEILLEKIPLVIVSVIGGIITFKMAAVGGSVTSFETLPVTYRIIFACYGYVMYLFRFLVPEHLSTFYPYPDLGPDKSLPPLFYLMPLFAIIISLVPFYFKWKKKENLYRFTFFGLSFYLFTIIFVLQFISAGGAIMADRYTYVSYFGIIFMCICLVNQLLMVKPILKYPVMVILTICSLLFSILCYARTKAWHNSETLWTDVLSKYPGSGSQIAYMNLGDYYAEKGDTANAFKNYSILTGMHTRLPSVYQNIGNIYAMRGQINKSLKAYSVALAYDSSLITIYMNRAVTYTNLHKFNLAIKDYSTLIRLMPNDPSNYFLRGNAEIQNGAFNAAINDYLHYLQSNPGSAECLYNLSIAYHNLNDNANALKYALMAQKAGYKVPEGYLSILKQ